MPNGTTSLRRALDRWLDTLGIRPAIVAELEDSAVLKVFGAPGDRLFAAPTAIESEVRRLYGVRVLGRTTDVIERFYAITVDRKIKTPCGARHHPGSSNEVVRIGSLHVRSAGGQ